MLRFLEIVILEWSNKAHHQELTTINLKYESLMQLVWSILLGVEDAKKLNIYIYISSFSTYFLIAHSLYIFSFLDLSFYVVVYKY